MQRYRHLRSPIRTELVMLLLIEQVQERKPKAQWLRRCGLFYLPLLRRYPCEGRGYDRFPLGQPYAHTHTALNGKPYDDANEQSCSIENM